MKKTTNSKPQRMFAMAMVAAMVTSMMPVTAFAEEIGNEGGASASSEQSQSAPAAQSQPKVTVTVTTNNDGSETKTTTSESTNADGASVKETKTENTAADNTKTETTEKTTTKETTTDNENGGTTTTVESETESKTTVTEPTKSEPKADDAGSDNETPAAGGEDEGNEGETPAAGGFESAETGKGDTETGYAEGSAASEFKEGTTTDVTTTTESNESSTDTTVTDHKDRVVEESGSSSGSETTETEETVTDKYIEDRDELEKDSYTDGQEQTLENNPGTFNNDGSVPTTTTTTTVDPGYAGDITINLTPGASGSGSANVDEAKLYEELLKDSRPEESDVKGKAQVEDVTDDEGNKIGTKTTTTDEKTNVVDKKNAAGEVVGYETTKTTTTTVVTETTNYEAKDHDPTVTTGETKTTTSEPVETIDLPERPAESENKNDAGETTKVTVEDIVDDNGNVVGYNVTRVTTDASGKEIGSGSESIWGTKTVTVTTKETLETTETKTEHITTTTTTTDITEGKTVNGVWITSTPRTATAAMGQVTVGEYNGTNDLEALNVDTATLLANLATNDLFNPDDQVDDKVIDGEMFHYVGHLVGSDYLVYRKDGNKESNTDVYIYVLKDKDGNEFYGYCADVATSAVKGKLYEIGNIEDENYYQNNANGQAEAHIRAIALNGFWGTASGTGSLAAVKQLLKDADYADWDTLTEGQALAATQAAMWKYGNNGDAYPVYDDDVTKRNFNTGANAAGDQGDKNIQKLYEVLIGLTEPRDSSTNVLDTSDITASSITIKEKAEDARNNDNNAANDVYNTDVSFTVAIVPDRDDTLKAVVYQNGQKVDEMSLTDSNGTQDGNGNTTYTLSGLKLQEGVNINLSLEGTQNLKKGVYLYTAELGVGDSQTFVGVAEGKRTVDLDVNMTFNVNDETATKNSKSGSNSRNKSGRNVTQTTDTEINQEVVALMEITTVTVTEHSSEWEEEYKKEYSYNDSRNKEEKEEEKKDDEKKEEFKLGDPDTTYIFDGDVPLAEMPDVEIPLGDFILEDVPKTNDASTLWMALSGFSGIGLAALFGRNRRK